VEIYNYFDKQMKFLYALAALIGLAATQDQCPEAKQISCVDDVRAAYPVCQKAAAAGGSDTIADLACLKYYNKMKGDCWPCICMIAKMDHMQIKGCWFVSLRYLFNHPFSFIKILNLFNFKSYLSKSSTQSPWIHAKSIHSYS
jgi:hypothetical protein